MQSPMGETCFERRLVREHYGFGLSSANWRLNGQRQKLQKVISVCWEKEEGGRRSTKRLVRKSISIPIILQEGAHTDTGKEHRPPKNTKHFLAKYSLNLKLSHSLKHLSFRFSPCLLQQNPECVHGVGYCGTPCVHPALPINKFITIPLHSLPIFELQSCPVLGAMMDLKSLPTRAHWRQS